MSVGSLKTLTAQPPRDSRYPTGPNPDSSYAIRLRNPFDRLGPSFRGAAKQRARILMDSGLAGVARDPQ